MGLGSSVKMVAKILHPLAGPVITLLYPIYASVIAIESNSNADTNQWLTYWVLFILINLLEYMLAAVLKWFPFWIYVKVMATCLLVLPCFSTYVYEHFVRPCFSLNANKILEWLSTKKNTHVLGKEDNFLLVSEIYIRNDGIEALEKLIITKDNSKEPSLANLERVLPHLVASNNTQKEWACALCMVTTTSKGCLKSHILGMRHKLNEELWANKRAAGKKNESPPFLKKTNGLYPIENLNTRTRPIRWCKWEKPEIGWIKLNTDGSTHIDNAGLGGLLRDHKGDPICAFVSKVPRDEIFTLELWAIWRGLVLALGQRIRAIWVESDSLGVVKSINRESPSPQKIEIYLRNIWGLLNRFEMYQVTHSWREANRAADHLAKMDIQERDLVLWPFEFPKLLCDIIKEDAQGMYYSRA